MSQGFLPQVGMEGHWSWVVGHEHSADALGNAGVLVLATPMVLDLMEIASVQALLPGLPDDWISLGIHAELRHLQATPLGSRVHATSRVVQVDGPKVTFQVEVFDEWEKVAEGTHTRYCLPRLEFDRRVAAKKVRPKPI